TMFSSIGSNDLKSLKAYLDTHYDDSKDAVTFIDYRYSIRPIIYTIDAADNVAKLNPSSLQSSMYSSQANSFMSTLSFGGNSVFNEMSENYESFKDQYDVLAGRWPEKYDELLLVLSEPNSISDLLIYSLGLRDTSELRSIINSVMSGEEVSVSNPSTEYSYEQLMGIDLRLIEPSDMYKYNVRYDVYEDMSGDDAYMRDLLKRSLKLNIVGIVCAKDDSSFALSTGINYTRDLVNYIIKEASRTAIVSKQLTNKDVDVFSNKRFDEVNEEEQESLDFNEMVSIDEDMIKDAFKFNIDEDAFNFETVDAGQMQNIVMDSAKTAADMIANTPDKTMLTGIFTLINSTYLQQTTQAYEQAHLEEIKEIGEDGQEILLSQKLNLKQEELDTAKNTISGTSYKQFAKNLLEANQQYIGQLPEGTNVSALLDMITASQYDSLASGVQAMFGSYYDGLKQIAVEDQIDYVKEENDTVYGSGEIQLRASALLAAQLGNQTALENTAAVISAMINDFTVYMIAGQIGAATGKMMEPMMDSFSKLGEMFGQDMMSVDTDKFAKAFRFNMDQEELSRLMETMMQGTDEKTAYKNLLALGYQDLEDPTSISFYFRDFAAKENFLAFLDAYNDSVDEDTKVRYTDITGILMSSVKTIVDVVTYVLIAFVSISLVVSSIMIAVITLISVLERTKEIGILRAMGASKRNVSSIFSAETFIIGALSGLLGVGVTIASLPLINRIIHNVANNQDVNAVLPKEAAIALILISIVLTILAGFIPSKKAAKQDPVIALRSE
ncbi:MAG: ABC transporter permease, partial [Erysipelotrichaceae bacterium]|nr:ABC transporter permease [Erysipelotrichaceae bacterium]